MAFDGPFGIPCAELRLGFGFSTLVSMGLIDDSTWDSETNRNLTHVSLKSPLIKCPVDTKLCEDTESELRNVQWSCNRERYAYEAKSDLSAEAPSPRRSVPIDPTSDLDTKFSPRKPKLVPRAQPLRRKIRDTMAICFCEKPQMAKFNFLSLVRH